jgi:hypothetical protein
MASMANGHNDKYVVACWLRLYNRRFGSTFKVSEWPDQDSSKPNIDALCQDDSGNLLAIEHTRIEPFSGEKADANRFMQTLAVLESDPDLLQPGCDIDISQSVGSVPNGTDWKYLRERMKEEVKRQLPNLKDGSNTVTIWDNKWSIELKIVKTLFKGPALGRFNTARIWPGDPGAELVLKALRAKVPKLSQHAGAKRILLLEKYAVAGTIESQFAQLPDDQEVHSLLGSIDEVWAANTMCLENEDTIFTSQIWPSIRDHFCSLNVRTEVFRNLEH